METQAATAPTNVRQTDDGTTSVDVEWDASPVSEVYDFMPCGATKTSVTFNWSGCSDANAYVIEWYDSNLSKYVFVGKTSETTFTQNGLNTEYSSGSYKIYPAMESSRGYLALGTYTSLTGKANTVPGKVKDIQKNYWYVYEKSNSLSLSWEAQNKAEGYQIKFYNTKNKCIGTYDANYNSTTISDLSGKSCVYVKIRSYVYLNDFPMYGAWSDKKWLIPAVYGKYTQREGSLTLNWRKVTGVTGYDVYIRTSYNGKAVKVKTIKGNQKTCKITSFKGKKIKRFGNYYVTVVAKKKVGKKTYTGLSE